jgi:hypothetical protein
MRTIISAVSRRIARWHRPRNAEAERHSTEERTMEPWDKVLPPSRALKIKGVNGSIQAEGGSGTQFRIQARKYGRPSDLARVNIEVVQDSEECCVRAVHPKGSHRRCNVRIDFTLEVPANVSLSAETTNGNVTVASVAQVTAVTVNGSIQIVGADQAEASSVNGSIEASLMNAKWQKPLHLRTVNGLIRVELSSDASVELRASTMNGTVTTDFPATSVRRQRHDLLDAVLGQAADCGQLICENMNGNIEVRRRT